MKKLIFVLLVSSLAGCGMFNRFIPVQQKWPEQKDQTLLQSCPDLKKIEGDQVAITDLLKSIVDNYTLYYQCSLKNEGWNEWYRTQKNLWEKKK